jgi:hypothetical protein
VWTDAGKVCLSLLGTWGTNNWSEHSSIMQVIVSIQGMILVPDPIFNEPGVESRRGQPSGDAADVAALPWHRGPRAPVVQGPWIDRLATGLFWSWL